MRMAYSTNDEQLGKVPAKPGILCVMSTVLHHDALSNANFCTWYEDTHVQQVQSTGGISRTERFERYIPLSRTDRPNEQLKDQICNYDFITVYHMSDLAFRETAAFKGLDGQSVPSDELVERIFKQTEFCTRFCEELPGDQETTSVVPDESSPLPYLVTIAIKDASSTQGRPIHELLSSLSQVLGATKTTTYKVCEASILSEFRRSYQTEPKNIILVECSTKPQVEPLLKAVQQLEGLELDIWALRRAYEGSEQGPAPWVPN